MKSKEAEYYAGIIREALKEVEKRKENEMSELTIIKCVVCESVIDHAEVVCYKCGVALRQPI